MGVLLIQLQLFCKEEFPGSTHTACTDYMHKNIVCTHCARTQGAWRHIWGTKRRCSAQPECAHPDSKTPFLSTRAMQNVPIHTECLCVQNWLTHTHREHIHMQCMRTLQYAYMQNAPTPTPCTQCAPPHLPTCMLTAYPSAACHVESTSHRCTCKLTYACMHTCVSTHTYRHIHMPTLHTCRDAERSTCALCSIPSPTVLLFWIN